MDFSFVDALAGLGNAAIVRIANEARPPDSYIFNSILPERNEEGYVAANTNMTVRTTMAGLVGMDSAYPLSGLVQVDEFKQDIPKLANAAYIPEEALRKMQQMLLRLAVTTNPTNDFIVNEALNFLDKVIIQAHMDAMEYLRGQALVFGAIDWTFSKLRLLVNYGVPSANFLTPRLTGAGTAYYQSGSLFWQDKRALDKILRYNTRAYILHPDTMDMIISNTANGTRVLNDTNAVSGGTVTIGRVLGNTEQLSQDVRDRVELIPYGYEGEIYDVTQPGKTLRLPFMPRGKILAVANNIRNEYYVGQGSTVDPMLSLALGYTHIGPTTEGGGNPGRWAQLYVDDDMPMQLRGRGVTNGLPVIDSPVKIAVATTDMG